MDCVPWTFDERFRIPVNEAIVAFIEGVNPAAHDDVASVLTDSAKGMPDVRWYCPDVHRYAYVVLHTKSDRIFGIAFGMNALAYRLPKEVIPQVLAEGGSIYSEIGDDWVLLEPWRADEPLAATGVRVRHWCKVAHDYAVGSEE
jgi:GMP synthase-like glutamine amidotransferase